MTQRRGHGRKIRGTRFSKKSVQYLLESGTLADMRAAKQITAGLVKYQWNYYAELARQRSVIQEEIQQALMQTCISYELKKWQRAVKYKYGLHPLSIMGSLNFIGGRFNTGTGVNTEVPFFPGLYLAQDKDTALQEHLGQEVVNSDFRISSRERALTNPLSETIVSVSGKLDKVYKFIYFIKRSKNFKVSKELMASAMRLYVPSPGTIKTTGKLLETLLHPNWRQLPSNYDVPANSQIFGHLIYSAGIEGIVYPSKFTSRLCLVIFPRNFAGTDSFVMLDDEPPHSKVPTRIDRTNWRISETEANEILYS